ncbi:MAG: sugar-binding transcriptional regulator, partial [Candidatus Humimicrobiaceae bacterium]
MDNFAKNKLLSKVARLYYIENYLQKDIAKKLSLS